MHSALKYRLKYLFTPPNLTTDPIPILAVAAIHGTLLAIFLGFLANYGFHRRTVREQLVLRLFQEAHEINAFRLGKRYLDVIPEQALTKAKQLIKSSTSHTQLAERLEAIVRYGGSINPDRLTNITQADEVAAQGREAFHLMFAILLHYPFPEAIESRGYPDFVKFRHIDEVKSRIADLEQVTKLLMRAYGDAPEGLSNVLRVYEAERYRDYSGVVPVFINNDIFLKSLNDAHEIVRRVNGRLVEIYIHQQSGIGTGWLLGGFLGAFLTFGIGVLTPLHNFPIPRRLVFWEPTFFYFLVLASIFYLIFIR